jgi:hypothetical protein
VVRIREVILKSKYKNAKMMRPLLNDYTYGTG